MATFQNTRTEIQEIKIILKNAQNQPKKKKSLCSQIAVPRRHSLLNKNLCQGGIFPHELLVLETPKSSETPQAIGIALSCALYLEGSKKLL